MLKYRLTTLLMVAALLAACQSNHQANSGSLAAPSTAPDSTAAQNAQALQANYQQFYPHARVGVVVGVLPGDSLAAVTNLPLNEFQPGDSLEFIDSNQIRIAAGTVVAVDKDMLEMNYKIVEAGRAPRPGDYAVRLVDDRTLN
jgi:hypothetical protein